MKGMNTIINPYKTSRKVINFQKIERIGELISFNNLNEITCYTRIISIQVMNLGTKLSALAPILIKLALNVSNIGVQVTFR